MNDIAQTSLETSVQSTLESIYTVHSTGTTVKDGHIVCTNKLDYENQTVRDHPPQFPFTWGQQGNNTSSVLSSSQLHTTSSQHTGVSVSITSTLLGDNNLDFSVTKTAQYVFIIVLGLKKYLLFVLTQQSILLELIYIQVNTGGSYQIYQQNVFLLTIKSTSTDYFKLINGLLATVCQYSYSYNKCILSYLTLTTIWYSLHYHDVMSSPSILRRNNLKTAIPSHVTMHRSLTALHSNILCMSNFKTCHYMLSWICWLYY